MRLVLHADDAATLRAGNERGDTLPVIAGEPGDDGRQEFAVRIGDTKLPALAIRIPEDSGSLVIETTDGDVIAESVPEGSDDGA